MRRGAVPALTAVLAAGPTVLAFASGGFFPHAPLVAAIGAWAVPRLGALVRPPPPPPRAGPAPARPPRAGAGAGAPRGARPRRARGLEGAERIVGPEPRAGAPGARARA